MRRHWLQRALAVGLLLGLYVGVWRPVRVWSVEHVFAPLLAAVAAPDWQVQPIASPPSVALSHGVDRIHYNAPAGRAFLVPALLLMALVPRVRTGARFFGVALALGAFGLLSAALAVRGLPGAAEMLGFLDAYVTMPLLVGLALWWSRLLPGADADRVSGSSIEAAPHASDA